EEERDDGRTTEGSNVTTGGDAGRAPEMEDASATSVDAARGDANTGTDAAQPEPVDPCRGMTGCVACTTDGQCPDPGSCLVRYCNTTKGICQPTFAPAETTCGASKCDG